MKIMQAWRTTLKLMHISSPTNKINHTMRKRHVATIFKSFTFDSSMVQQCQSNAQLCVLLRRCCSCFSQFQFSGCPDPPPPPRSQKGGGNIKRKQCSIGDLQLAKARPCQEVTVFFFTSQREQRKEQSRKTVPGFPTKLFNARVFYF